jgi:imidazole glycerol-phosphate synthase subunit HisH
LGLVEGHVERIAETDDAGSRKVPHAGWSVLKPAGEEETWRTPLLDVVRPNMDAVYFVHSFACQPAIDAEKYAVADYNGYEICAVVVKDNVLGMQFHPEKSGKVGLAILNKFAGI